MYSVTWAQLGIGTKTPDSSAALDISSTEQGLLPPRMTTAQRDAINGGTVAEGLVIYNIDEKCLQYWDGTEWLCNSKKETSSSTNIPLKKSIDNSLAQIFAIDDYKTFFTYRPESEISSKFHAFTWIDSSKFATFHSTFFGNNQYRKAVVTIYDLNFGKIKEFILDDFEGWWTDGEMTVLGNGNLVVATDHWMNKAGGKCSSSYCSKVGLFDQDGNKIEVHEIGFTAMPFTRDVFALDNDNYIVSYHYGYSNRTVVFNSDGTKNKEVAESSYHSYDNLHIVWSPTSYGYIVMDNNKYNAYDFEGDLIGSNNITLNDPSIMAINTGYDGGKNLIRAEGDILYFNSDQGFFKIDAGKDGATILAEKKLVAKDIALTERARWGSIIGGALNQDKIIYLGWLGDSSSQPTTSVPVGVFSDGSPLNQRMAGYYIMSYDSNSNKNDKVKYIAFPPGARLKQSYYNIGDIRYDSDQQNFNLYKDMTFDTNNVGVPSNSLKLSPDKKHILVSRQLGYYDISDLISVFDISELDNIKRPTHIAKSNGVKQHIGKRFIVTGPERMLSKVVFKITEGYQKGDKLESYCSTEWIDCSSVYNTLTIASSEQGKEFNLQFYIQVMNEITFSSNASAGTRVIEAQATTFSGKAGEVLKFSLEVSD